MMLYPKSAQVLINTIAAAFGTVEILPAEGPMVLFVWGPTRVLPVRLTSLSITEEAFDTLLNPTRAKVDLTLHGDLTLHSVMKSVDIPARTQLGGGRIQIAGSLAFPFSDFGINPPNVGGFVTVEDNGTLEFLVNLTKG